MSWIVRGGTAAETTRRHVAAIAALITALVVACLLAPLRAQATEDPDVSSSASYVVSDGVASPSDGIQTIRVGYYPSRSFLEGAGAGEAKSGYGYEYLQRVASYAGWRFEYVYGTWDELYEKLACGEIDILPGVSRIPAHESEVLFPSASMLNETFYVYRNAYDDSLAGNDLSTFEGKRIGVAEKTNSESNFREWLDDAKCGAQEVVYPTIDEMRNAFGQGEIDAFVSSDNVAHGFEGVVPIEIVGKEPYYLAVAPDRGDLLRTVNGVQSIMISQDRLFLDELQIRYAADSAASAYLTSAEIEWTESHSTLTVGYLNNYLPYCDTDKNGNATGLMVDVLAAAFDSLPGTWTPEITYRAFDDQQDLFDALTSGAIDVAFPVGGDTWYAENNGFSRSTAVTSPSMELVSKSDVDFAGATTKIAVNKHNLLQQNYVELHFPNAERVVCDSIDECLDAVRDGRAGCTVVNGLRSGALLNSETQLVSTQLPGSDGRCFGVVAGNGVLLQLLNRGLGLIGENYGANISYRYTEGLYTYTLSDFVRDNWGVFAAACAVVALFTLLLAWRRFRTIRRESAREAEHNRQLEEALALAERANQAKDVLLGNLSHDIRTPLNGILGVMDVNASCDDVEVVKANMAKAKRAARQLLCLVDDLLEMSKLKSGDIELGSEAFSLADVFSDVIDGVRSQAEDSGVVVRCAARPDGECCGAQTCDIMEALRAEQVVGSPTYLRQVLTNVFDNAVRYNKAGGEVVWDARLEPAGDGRAQFTCTVRDTGEGMDAESLERLFEPFFQADSGARTMYPGSGLGMSIAGELVRLMGGTINVESEQGQGTTVVLSVPFSLASRPSADASEPNDARGIDGMRILVAEDNDLNLEITRCVLEREGAKVVVARDGAQALSAFERSEEGSIDAIVMDLMMPVMDGYEATRAIRALDRHDAIEVPIVAMTANAFESDRTRAFEAGMDEHLTKPVDPARLVATLAKHRR